MKITSCYKCKKILKVEINEKEHIKDWFIFLTGFGHKGTVAYCRPCYKEFCVEREKNDEKI